jgi:hypothetical protein
MRSGANIISRSRGKLEKKEFRSQEPRSQEIRRVKKRLQSQGVVPGFN